MFLKVIDGNFVYFYVMIYYRFEIKGLMIDYCKLEWGYKYKFFVWVCVFEKKWFENVMCMFGYEICIVEFNL